MLCGSQTLPLDLFIHVPLQKKISSMQHRSHFGAIGIYRTHCFLYPTRYSFIPERSEAHADEGHNFETTPSVERRDKLHFSENPVPFGYRIRTTEMKWNESGFRPPLCTYRLNWARRTSWGWWDDWDDTVLQTQDLKFEPWRSEAEHATSRSRRLPTILTFTRGWGRNIFVSFKPPIRTTGISYCKALYALPLCHVPPYLCSIPYVTSIRLKRFNDNLGVQFWCSLFIFCIWI